MRRNEVLFLFLLCLTFPAGAQFASVPADARSCALGGVRDYVDVTRHVSIDYRHGFMLSEMSTRSIEAAFPLGRMGSVVARYSHFGDYDYAEQQAFAGYYMSLNDWLSMGVAGRYLRLGTSDGHYLPQQWLALVVAAKATLSPSLYFTGQTGTRPWDEERPWQMSLGMGYRPVNHLLALVEVESEDRLRMHCGAEYCYREHYFLRAGFSTAPLALSFGVGARFGNYSIDIAAADYQTLGITPQISLALWF